MNKFLLGFIGCCVGMSIHGMKDSEFFTVRESGSFMVGADTNRDLESLLAVRVVLFWQQSGMKRQELDQQVSQQKSDEVVLLWDSRRSK